MKSVETLGTGSHNTQIGSIADHAMEALGGDMRKTTGNDDTRGPLSPWKATPFFCTCVAPACGNTARKLRGAVLARAPAPGARVKLAIILMSADAENERRRKG